MNKISAISIRCELKVIKFYFYNKERDYQTNEVTTKARS